MRECRGIGSTRNKSPNTPSASSCLAVNSVRRVMGKQKSMAGRGDVCTEYSVPEAREKKKRKEKVLPLLSLVIKSWFHDGPDNGTPLVQPFLTTHTIILVSCSRNLDLGLTCTCHLTLQDKLSASQKRDTRTLNYL